MGEFEVIDAGLETGRKQIQEAKSSQPHFTVKARDKEGFVGSAWLNEGQYGKYISVKLREDMVKGATLYLSPTKANAGLLG
ncbi:MAG: hypothetical protein NTY90_04985 [Candidatus Micrarchaeota archaeon]|nr:hypothetical protein [Candidatus Micrarchaeota archaeon]